MCYTFESMKIVHTERETQNFQWGSRSVDYRNIILRNKFFSQGRAVANLAIGLHVGPSST